MRIYTWHFARSRRKSRASFLNLATLSKVKLTPATHICELFVRAVFSLRCVCSARTFGTVWAFCRAPDGAGALFGCSRRCVEPLACSDGRLRCMSRYCLLTARLYTLPAYLSAYSVAHRRYRLGTNSIVQRISLTPARLIPTSGLFQITLALVP